MRERFAGILSGCNADYVEIRFEQSQTTQISYRGGKLEEVGRTYSSGGNVRALVKGGWGFACSNSVDKLGSYVDLAIKQAKLTSGEELALPSTEPVVDMVEAPVNNDAASMPLVKKKELFDEYNDIMLTSPQIQDSRISYRDVNRKVIFANSNGSYIEQNKPDLTLRLTAIARGNGEIQQAGLSLGSVGDFSVIENLHDQVREIAKRAAALLHAPEVKGGEYAVILDPVLAGVFAHEAFGHLSEADFVYQNEPLKQVMVLGKSLGASILTSLMMPPSLA